MFNIYINDIRYSVGADCFLMSQGKANAIYCNVCHSKCLVERNVEGIKVKYASGTGLETMHDKFFCPNSENNWHKKALGLYLESQKTDSKRISMLIRKDLDEILTLI